MQRQPLSTFLAIFIGLSISPAALAISPRVIYGDDNRQDYFQVMDAAWRNRADATVALIRASNLDTQGNVTNIKTVAYGQGMGLCSNEPFYEQETAAFCSGSLVTPDTIVTAGHCVRTQESCNSTRFVFGFRLDAAGVQPRQVASDHVFACAKLIHSVANATGEDFAVVKLDHPVPFVQPLPFRTSGRPAAGDELTVMGHPAGLPLKIAGHANVRKVEADFMVTNLDTYGGNSGSAVFSSVTGEIEGVLVRGEMDFIYKNGCRTSNVCDPGGCRGEDVTLFERVLPHLQ